MTPDAAPSPGRFVAFAPAKLNLTLAVTDRRADGFHNLHSVFAPLVFGDEIALEVDPEATEDRLAVEGSTGRSDAPDGLSGGPDNLVLRAIAATRGRLVEIGFGGAMPPLTVRLAKRIPVAAGLGGGSSDAAATIQAALRAWHAALPPRAIGDLAAALGSDVPFFLAGGPALVTGRGESVEPLPPLRGVAPAVLIVTPRFPVSTPAVFAAYAAGARPADPQVALATSQRLASDWRSGMPASALLDRAADLAAANDLMPAALAVAPGLADVRDALDRLLGRPVGLSGSGPTSWILFGTVDDAERGAAIVRAAATDGRPRAIAPGEPFVAATAIGAPSPHNGAQSHPER